MNLPTVAQLWARERNWNKARITGIISTLRSIELSLSATVTEKESFYLTIYYLEPVIQYWEDNNKESKKQFLKKGGK